MNFDKSKCRKHPYFHKFAIIKDAGGDVLERCVRCGKKHVIKVAQGQVDVTNYARYHAREFLIPQHPLFAKEYKKV